MPDWFTTDFSLTLAVYGVVSGLIFNGYSLWETARPERAKTVVEMIKLHRELWLHYEAHPKLASLFDRSRSMRTDPLRRDEARFANLLFLHIHGAYTAHAAHIYRLPRMLPRDLHDTFSHPAILAAWLEARDLHDPDFVVFIEKLIAK